MRSSRVDTAHLTGQLPDLVRDVQLPGGYNLDDYSTTQVRNVADPGGASGAQILMPACAVTATFPIIYGTYAGPFA